ncbi:MAG: HNH endonuclease [Coleofasciculus sp. B1-GNL1-01]|uniref:HNH endonuclease n=1 Tax=Coleofasciculus sp. B1-GNL1-01 TaxID=3068484 RepID=UPI0032FA9A1D
MSQGQQSETRRTLAFYCDCFPKINVYKNKQRGGKALNQPVLLLSVIDLIAQGLIQDNKISISDELIDTFQKYWNLLNAEAFKNSDFALPFFHLKNSEGRFWHLQFSAAYDGGRPQTINTLRRDVDYAYLDDQLFELIQDQNHRQELVDALVAAWFSSQGKALEEILKINQAFQDSSQEEEEVEQSSSSTQSEKQPRFYLRKSLFRDAIFRKTVVHIYDYKCAFCRLKITRTFTQNIVDGAHIKPFSEFYDSQIDNGLSLCKNHHWAFDHGWFCLDDNYKIIIASDLQEESPHSRPMKDFHGETILLPSSEEYFPRLEALQWHRQTKFVT